MGKQLLSYLFLFSLFNGDLAFKADQEINKSYNSLEFSENNKKNTLNENNKSVNIIWEEVVNEENIVNDKPKWEPVRNPENYYIKKNNYSSYDDKFSLSNIEWPEKKTPIQERLRLGGLSVSNAEPLNSGEKKVSYSLNNHGTWSNKNEWGLSNKLSFDLAFSSIGQNSILGKTETVDYHDLNKLFVRGGAKANLWSQSNGDLITSSARVSAGRLRGWGWLFTELINTYSISDKISLNLNPKLSLSGIANSSAIGTSINWEILRGISLIPEFNFALNNSSDNWTTAIRISKLKDKYIDLYTTNSLNFVDTGQLFRSDEQSYGLNIGFVF